MARKFLVRKDSSDSRDHLAMPSLASLPNSVNLLPMLGPVRNQGQAGSCTGQAGAGFADFLYRAYHKDYSKEFSALYLYAKERILNGSFPQDVGSDSRSLMRVLCNTGICLDSQDPYSDSETSIAAIPTMTMDSDASSNKIGAYHRVLFDSNLLTAKSVLASGYCRVIGIPVYSGIESDECAETGILPLPSQTDTPIGGHEMLVYGYTVDNFELVRNSWGSAWGLNGDLKIPTAYYDLVGGNDTCDSWIGHFGRPWNPKVR